MDGAIKVTRRVPIIVPSIILLVGALLGWFTAAWYDQPWESEQYSLTQFMLAGIGLAALAGILLCWPTYSLTRNVALRWTLVGFYATTVLVTVAGSLTDIYTRGYQDIGGTLAIWAGQFLFRTSSVVAVIALVYLIFIHHRAQNPAVDG